jgi:hypothetical protein
MAGYPYILVPNKLKEFMNHVQAAGMPLKVTRDYLKSAGFKSNNERAIITVLRFIGFIDSGGAPTDKWVAYRNKGEAPNVLGNAIRQAYGQLFDMYPDAHQKDSEALRNFFATHTNVGDKAVSTMVSTFQALCSIARFEAAPISVQNEPGLTPPISGEEALGIQTLTINLQLTLPATADSSVYEKIFEAMKKHLLGKQ